AYLTACRDAALRPGTDHDLSALRSVGSTGSPLPPEGFDWTYREVKGDVWLTSMSGGTDVCSAFVGGCPLRPVRAGEIQCRALGCYLEAYDEAGRPVRGAVGEMVILVPMPSMPIYFWNDPDGARYRAAYFDTYPGVWRHGDWTEITEHDGVVILGRSDATLNRGGVRIGTSEIYRAVAGVPAVADSLVVGVERPDGGYFMPLFVRLHPGHTLDDALRREISRTLRQHYSPRHVPDEIHAAPDVPYTISGKKLEAPVKRILQGTPPEQAANPDAMRNPESLAYFVRFARDAR
ncbi:MAG: acetoacetate--CoA ligase, partial [Catalinimonas sp.]